MKKSKHFRKDVILARIIFVTLCILLGVGIGMGISAISKKPDKNINVPPQDTQTQINTPSTQSPEENPNPEGDDVENTETEQNTEDVVYYAVPTTELRLREEPSTDSDVLAGIPAGTKVTLIEELNGWYKVSYDGMEGYISADYATIETEGGAMSNSSSHVIMIDPGHQRQGDATQELNGPNSSDTKARVTNGAVGTTSGVAEYELTLEIGELLKKELESRGYTVLMTRETHDVNISNMERALMANEAGAEVTIRIHANSYSDASVYGAETLAPSTGNPYVGDIAEASQKLSQSVISAYCDATGMHNRGVKIDDTMTGINWCDMPVTIIELGFLSNPTDDTNMQDDAYQQKMAKGIADGLDAYFGL